MLGVLSILIFCHSIECEMVSHRDLSSLVANEVCIFLCFVRHLCFLACEMSSVPFVVLLLSCFVQHILCISLYSLGVTTN